MPEHVHPEHYICQHHRQLLMDVVNLLDPAPQSSFHVNLLIDSLRGVLGKAAEIDCGQICLTPNASDNNQIDSTDRVCPDIE
jgi:hypothetical protein